MIRILVGMNSLNPGIDYSGLLFMIQQDQSQSMMDFNKEWGEGAGMETRRASYVNGSNKGKLIRSGLRQ